MDASGWVRRPPSPSSLSSSTLSTMASQPQMSPRPLVAGSSTAHSRPSNPPANARNLALADLPPILGATILPIPPPTPVSAAPSSALTSPQSRTAMQQCLPSPAGGNSSVVPPGILSPPTPAPSPGPGNRTPQWRDTTDGRDNEDVDMSDRCLIGRFNVPGMHGDTSPEQINTHVVGHGEGVEDDMRGLWRDNRDLGKSFAATFSGWWLTWQDPASLLAQFQAYSPSDRFAFLSLLVAELRLPEALVVSRKIEPRLKRDFLRELPSELALQCLSFVGEAKTLARASQVSKHWYNLLQDEQTWKEMCDRHRFTPSSSPLSSSAPPSTSTSHTSPQSRRDRFKRELPGGLGIRGADTGPRTPASSNPNGRGAIVSPGAQQPHRPRGGSPNASPSVPSYVPASLSFKGKSRQPPLSFKAQFKNAYLTQSNWLHGGRVFKEHVAVAEDDGVVTSLAIDDNFLVIGMANCRIHIFDTPSGKYLRTLEGHNLGVWAVVLVTPYSTRDDTPDSSPSPDHLSSYPRAYRDSGGSGRYRDEGISRRASFGATSADTSAPTQDSRSHLRDLNSSHSGTAWGINRPSTSAGILPDSPSVGDRNGRGVPGEEQQSCRVRSSDVCGAARGWAPKRGKTSRNLIVSGGCDRMVKVWDVDTGECVHALSGHQSTVRCLKVLDRRPVAISGSRDASLRVWDIERGQLLRQLSGHEDSVRCVEIAGNRVVSGSYDNTARIWDVDTGQCLHVLRGHYHQIYAVAFDGERVVTGSLDSTVRVWNAATGECVALLQGHTSLVGQLQLVGDRLVTGGSDGRVIIFDLSTYECIYRLCAHDNSVTCVQFDDRFIISGGNDGRVKLWDIRTGTFVRELTRACDSVWRIGCKDDRVAILCRRNGRTVLEILTFRPGDEVGRRLIAPPATAGMTTAH